MEAPSRGQGSYPVECNVRRTEPTKQMVKEETDIRHPAADHRLDPRGAVLLRFALAPGQFRSDELGVIQRGDDVSMTGEMRGEERTRPTVPTARVGVDDERTRGKLQPFHFGWMSHVAGEHPTACLVGRLDRPLTDRKWAGSERIVATGAGQCTGIRAAGWHLSQWPDVHSLLWRRPLEIDAGRASR